jgi:hypothetical protein
MSINDVSVTEGDSGTKPAVFAVTLSTTSTSTVTAHFATADGTAHAPGDYTASSGTVTFNPGDTSKTVSVAVKGDTLAESNETFHVDLSSPSNATIADAQGIGTILDDDVSGPAVVSGLFCGVKHHGKCKGNPFKGIADRPGNAAWTFGAYDPTKGAPPSAVAAKSKLLKLGTIKTIVKKRGVFKVVFKLKAGAKTKKLYKQAVKLKVKVLRVKVVLTGPGGFRQVKESDFKLKL